MRTVSLVSHRKLTMKVADVVHIIFRQKDENVKMKSAEGKGCKINREDIC